MRFTGYIGRAVVMLLLIAGVFAAAFSVRAQKTAGVEAEAQESVIASPLMTSSPARRQKANGRIVYQSVRNDQNEIFSMDADGSNTTQLTDNNVDDLMPNWSPDGAKIAFVSRRDDIFGEIYVMNVDGGNVVRLTNNFISDYDPVWSPDGKRIAFRSYRDGNAEIYVMNADGSSQTRLTTNPGDDTEPAWSPDGSRIAFTSVQNGNTDIYVINADGANQQRLTEDAAVDKSPSWSPDGNYIIFVSARLVSAEIFKMNTDGSSETHVSVNMTGSQFDPEYSPDGKKITLVSNGAGEPEIFSMNSDGSSPVRLTNNPTYDMTPSWQPLNVNGRITFNSQRSDSGGSLDIYSVMPDGTKLSNLTKNTSTEEISSASPDGTRIAFDSFRNANHDIYMMSADGSFQTRLTTHTAKDIAPAWSPDGTKIAFTSDRDGNREIYVMNADGTNQTRVTDNSADDSYPTWSLSSTQLAFQSDRDGQSEIFVINADGTGEKKLASGQAFSPKWSPDGSKIAFASSRDGDLDIFVMTADGKNAQNLTKSVGSDAHPTWSPDATKIAFTSIRDGNWEIYYMNADGSGQTRLTVDTASDEEPSWKTIGLYFIKGRVTSAGVGIPGVTVHLSIPGLSASMVEPNVAVVGVGLVGVTSTDATGVFIFESLEEDASYEVTPLKTNYTFNPQNYVLTDLNASKYVTFTGTMASYTISGKVTDGQYPMAGLTLKLSGSKTASVLTDFDGNYSFTVLGGGNYTVTPSYPNYTFAPAQRSYSSLSAPQTNQDFAGTLNKHTISGVIKLGTSGLANVTVTLSSPTESFTPLKATTDANGAYSFAAVPAGRTYTVTPTKVHYSFTPPTRTYTGLSANQPAANFAATLNTYTIAGTIKVGTTALSGVTVTLSSPTPAGFVPRTTTTTLTGAYSFGSVPAGRTYVVTPAKLHYTFTPAARTYSNLSASQTTANFAATLKTYTIAGTVTLNGTSTGLYQVALTIASPTAGFTPRTVYTNTAGAYVIAALPAGRSYTVTPAKLNYTFTPALKSYSSLAGNFAGQNFSATLKTYTVSGLITRTGTTTGIPTVAVTITSATPAGFVPRTVQTNTAGVYTITGLPAGRTYTIKPVKAGFTFTPLARTVTNLSGNIAVGSLTNFTGVQ